MTVLIATKTVEKEHTLVLTKLSPSLVCMLPATNFQGCAYSSTAIYFYTRIKSVPSNGLYDMRTYHQFDKS
jgi:hypothetical protein